MTAPTVGLTGGIATGKSTVAGFFRALGIPIVDADQVARDVVAVGSDGFNEVVREFGDSVVASDGTLDREALGARVFGDDAERAKLNAIVHPRIAVESQKRLLELAQTDAPYVIYEAALIVENGLHRAFAALVVVALDEERQLARLMARNDYDEAEARARIASQLPLADKVALADHVIENGGSLPETEIRVREVDRALRAALASSDVK